jgi:NAD(P)H dehydrogenase (quinone)
MGDGMYLVAGAAGPTGRSAVRSLREGDHGVRALVRQHDGRSDALQALGAEVVTGDFHDLDAMRRALDGVDGAYFVHPVAPGIVEATSTFARAALRAGTPTVVNMSQSSARRDSGSPASRAHWLAERVLDRSGLGVTHLRPTFFAEWFTYPFVRYSVAEAGELRLPFGAGRHAPIAAEDQGRVIAAILRDPEPHRGHTYFLCGADEGTHDDHAASIGRALGRRVVYRPISDDAFVRAIHSVLPGPRWDHLVQHVTAVAGDYRANLLAGTNDLVERVSGRRPLTVEQFIAKRASAFEPPAAAV